MSLMARGRSWQTGKCVLISQPHGLSRDRVYCQAHGAAVTKLSWAHPEFGSVLASSSFDRTVKVWEEIPAESTDQPQTNGASMAADGPGTRWVERAVLADAKGTVRAVEFAPHQLGLKLVRALRRSPPCALLTTYR